MTKARDVSSRGGLTQVIPTSVAVGSGSATVGANGIVSFSGASNVTFNGCFNSSYENYKIVLSAIQNTGNADWNLTLTSGGSTASSSWGTSAYAGYAATSGALFQSNSQSGATTTLAAAGGGGYTRSNIDFYAPAIAIPTTFTSLYMSAFSGAGTNTGSFLHGYHTASTAYDGIRIAATSHTITGTVRIYGYNNG